MHVIGTVYLYRAALPEVIKLIDAMVYNTSTTHFPSSLVLKGTLECVFYRE